MLSKSLLFFKSCFTALYAAPFQLITHFTHFLRLRADTLFHFSPCSPEVALSKLFSISSNAFWIMSKVSVWIMSKVSVLDHVKGVCFGSCQGCLFGIMSKVSVWDHVKGVCLGSCLCIWKVLGPSVLFPANTFLCCAVLS